MHIAFGQNAKDNVPRQRRVDLRAIRALHPDEAPVPWNPYIR